MGRLLLLPKPSSSPTTASSPALGECRSRTPVAGEGGVGSERAIASNTALALLSDERAPSSSDVAAAAARRTCTWKLRASECIGGDEGRARALVGRALPGRLTRSGARPLTGEVEVTRGSCRSSLTGRSCSPCSLASNSASADSERNKDRPAAASASTSGTVAAFAAAVVAASDGAEEEAANPVADAAVATVPAMMHRECNTMALLWNESLLERVEQPGKRNFVSYGRQFLPTTYLSIFILSTMFSNYSGCECVARVCIGFRRESAIFWSRLLASRDRLTRRTRSNARI